MNSKSMHAAPAFFRIALPLIADRVTSARAGGDGLPWQLGVQPPRHGSAVPDELNGVALSYPSKWPASLHFALPPQAAAVKLVLR